MSYADVPAPSSPPPPSKLFLPSSTRRKLRCWTTTRTRSAVCLRASDGYESSGTPSPERKHQSGETG